MVVLLVDWMAGSWAVLWDASSVAKMAASKVVHWADQMADCSAASWVVQLDEPSAGRMAAWRVGTTAAQWALNLAVKTVASKAD